MLHLHVFIYIHILYDLIAKTFVQYSHRCPHLVSRVLAKLILGSVLVIRDSIVVALLVEKFLSEASFATITTYAL